MGILHLILVVLAITSVSWIGKLSVKRGVGPLDLTFVMFLSATLLGCFWTLVNRVALSDFTSQLWVISAVAGIGGVSAVFVFNHAIRLGHFGYSNAIYRSSFLVPVVYGIFFLNSRFHFMTGLGIALILTAVFLVSFSNDSFHWRKDAGREFRWFCVIFTAFLMSGLPRIGQLLISVNKLNSSAYLLASYAAGFGVILFCVKRISLNRWAWIYGSLAAAASFAGVFCTIEAIKSIPAYVVFPVTLSAPILLGMGISRLYREKIRKLGIAGIGLGVLGIVILAFEVYGK